MTSCKKTLYMTVLFLLTGCNLNNRIEKFDLNAVLRSKVNSAILNEPLKLNICNAIPFKWDGVIVVPPYTSENVIDTLDIDNASSLAKEISKTYLNEGICTLAFIESGTVVKLSTVSRLVVDMANLASGKDYLMILPKAKFCENLYVKKEGSDRITAYLKP